MKPRFQVGVLVLCCLAAALTAPTWAASKKGPAVAERPVAPQLDLPGGRKLTYEGSFESERDVRGKRGFWKKLLDVVAGEPAIHDLIRPYSIVTDGNQRIIITDPGSGGVHLFDFEKRSYKFITHSKGHDTLKSPQCVAVDEKSNIYVTDSTSGKIFVFDVQGKFHRTIGSIPGGEGFFKRPTGIAIDSAAQLIYVTDTLRHKIYVLDMQGKVERTIGQNGSGTGEFNYPTELHLEGDKLVVVDAMNFRIQRFEANGTPLGGFGQVGDGEAHLFRPKGVAIDSEGHFYVADGFHNVIQVFDREGNLLYTFGSKGIGPGEFQLPAGMAIDRQNRVFVVDSYNRRVQVFHYFGSSSDRKQ